VGRACGLVICLSLSQAGHSPPRCASPFLFFRQKWPAGLAVRRRLPVRLRPLDALDESIELSPGRVELGPQPLVVPLCFALSTGTAACRRKRAGSASRTFTLSPIVCRGPVRVRGTRTPTRKRINALGGPDVTRESYDQVVRSMTGKDRAESPSDWPVAGLLGSCGRRRPERLPRR
jgi:hypothetical protein